jgi:chromosome partitioning protein
MAETAQALMQLARTRALAPSMEKTTRALSLAELADLIQVPRKTIEYAIETKSLPAGMISGRKRLFTLAEVALFRQHFNRVPHRPPGTTPCVVGVANFKGGVGKTSTAVHLGQYLALQGYRVLMVDLDAQASLTTLFGLLPDSDVPTELTALPFFSGNLPSLAGSIRHTYWHGLDLLPANLALYNAEFALARRQNSESGFRFYAVLKEGLDAVGRDYDVIVLDTPPALGFVTTNAMYAANGLVIPITPAMMDFASAAQFFQLVAEHVDVINQHEGGDKRFRFVRLLVSKFEANNKVHETIEEWIRQGFESAVFSKNMALSAALRTGPELQTAYEMTSYAGDRRTLQRAMKFLEDVNGEIEKLIRQQWAQEIRQREYAGADA